VSRSSVAALVAAHDEADRIAATVAAVRSIPDVREVFVVDDGSTDGTGEAARLAGARVLRRDRRAGKGAALEAGLSWAPWPQVWLLVDGDLGVTAAGAAPLVREVIEGHADLAIGIVPARPGGGFGLVKRTSRWWIRRLCGFEPVEPLSGQRAVTASALAGCRPLASGFGVETAMTIDAVRAGLRVVEVPIDVSHRPTGRGVRGFAHRGRQGLDIFRAVRPRAGRGR
jgi:hypothetical protein